MRTTRRSALAATLGVAVFVGFCGVAQAIPVGKSPVPSYQTNGRVTAIAISGTTAYIGGKFTSVRPAGTAAGTGEVARNHAAAIDLVTGNVLMWNPAPSAVVDAIAVSADGKTVYLGGSFGKIGTKSHKDLAAVDATTGALITGFKAAPALNGEVRAIALSNGMLVIGGAFTTPRADVAALDPSTGALIPAFAPTTDGPVEAIATTQDGTNEIVLGGAFNTLNSVSSSAIGAVSPATGASLPWAWHGPIRFGSHPFDVVQLLSDPSGVYAGGTGNGGTFLKFSSAGTMLFEGGLNGNDSGIALLNGELYVGGHFTAYCGPIMGFNNCPTSSPGAAARDHLLVVDATTGALDTTWHPAANSSLGVFAIAAGDSTVAVGGDFTKLAGVSQQGVGMFR